MSPGSPGVPNVPRVRNAFVIFSPSRSCVPSPPGEERELGRAGSSSPRDGRNRITLAAAHALYNATTSAPDSPPPPPSIHSAGDHSTRQCIGRLGRQPLGPETLGPSVCSICLAIRCSRSSRVPSTAGGGGAVLYRCNGAVLWYHPPRSFTSSLRTAIRCGSTTTHRTSLRFSSSKDSSPLPPPTSSTTPRRRRSSPKVSSMNLRRNPHLPLFRTRRLPCVPRSGSPFSSERSTGLLDGSYASTPSRSGG